MSTSLNLSSSEDEDDEDEESYSSDDEKVEENDLTPVHNDNKKVNVSSSSNSAPSTTKSSTDDDDDDDDNDDDINWEDGAPPPSSSTHQTIKHIKLPTRDITIDFTIPTTNSNTNRKRRRPQNKKTLTKIPHRHLPPEISDLVISLHHAHLLSLLSHIFHLSHYICDDELCQSVAYSLIPPRLFPELQQCRPRQKQQQQARRRPHQKGAVVIPSERHIRELSTWYFDLVNGVDERRRTRRERAVRLGAPGGGGRRRGAGRGKGGKVKKDDGEAKL